jgi:hypothetical protein
MSEKRMKAAASQAVSYRNYRRARDRALVRLASAYPETYKELLELEKASDEQLGKKWLDINGTTTASELGLRPTTELNASSQASNRGENEGNNGGEA